MSKKTSTKTFSIENDTYRKFEDICKSKQINKSKIIQEAINNAIKYADSSHILVSLSHSKNILSIVVDDDGGIHVTWMRSPNALISQRQIYYNYISPTGAPLAGFEGVGMRCDYALYKSGYCTIDAMGCQKNIAQKIMQWGHSYSPILGCLNRHIGLITI
jgi:hypothetical protein